MSHPSLGTQPEHDPEFLSLSIFLHILTRFLSEGKMLNVRINELIISFLKIKIK